MHNSASTPDVRQNVWRGVVSLAVVFGTSMAWPDVARADDWGCQVMLCLSNLGGPEQYAECVSPIERLWAALRDGDPFPTCDLATVGTLNRAAHSNARSAQYPATSVGYPLQQIVRLGEGNR
ncbi:conserved hypothetical protein [Burkholderia vietnamiensis G4]|uniref:Uncharacterized protein n=1 Tax=Burkholderia vietnamiensis (strain G4 / LMG 22486) TaxID=269482 RepID=A4JR10_BURVG|nr:conserved hypothetical protein [Burkholderia vietnamiensis G4]RQM57654.1 hypothetical protein EHZ18_13955 [Burkholderia vietnamiensis]